MCHHQHHKPIQCNRPLPPNSPSTKCTATLYPQPTLIKCPFAELMPSTSLQSQCWELDTSPGKLLTEASEESKEKARDRCRVCRGTRSSTEEEEEEDKRVERGKRGRLKKSSNSSSGRVSEAGGKKRVEEKEEEGLKRFMDGNVGRW
ncbi:hypothetical protein QBC38DRAFT_142486 [Podospora fimiseda]|uniref:Uncharacterized protein n=1 Tax=Podospora fimiseda TaxID=252190 RepID=A0AAN6YLX8_9PEZI|nr:hypothetical protein QBC38DRAFT_142486 [Podospora fimiseda]